MVVDKAGLAGLRLADPLQGGPIDAPALVARAGWGALSIEDLSARTGLALQMLSVGKCPCAALPILPTTAKTLTGVVTNTRGQVLDDAGVGIGGLYAAGEIAGFGGGRHPPVDSTMIAGAILSGRDAGRDASLAR